MSLTIARIVGQGDQFIGTKRVSPRTLTGDAAYAGGYPLTPQTFGGRKIISVRIVSVAAAAGARLRGVWNYVAGTLCFFQASQRRDYVPGGGDLKGATNPAGTENNADQSAAPVNAGLWKAATAVSVLAGTITPTTQPAAPRNAMITVTNDSGGALDLFEGTTPFVITGTDVNGVALTETVNLVSTAGNKSVATAKFRYLQGVKAFRTITSVTYTNAPAATLKLGIGPGTRFALPGNLASGASTDVLNASVNNVPLVISATVANAGGVDTTNNTINSGTIADGDDLSVSYNDSGEVPAGTDLSGVVVRADIETVG